MCRLSRGLDRIERFLQAAGFDRAPWLAVAFGAGIASWFALPAAGYWLMFIAACMAAALASMALLGANGAYPMVRLALISVAITFAAGCGSVWTRSMLVGTAPIAAPGVAMVTGRVLSVEAQPAQGRSRAILAVREPGTGRAIRVRVNLPDDLGEIRIAPGALVRMRARLVPPAPPMLPGAYDFARSAWFDGLAATGTALDAPIVLEPGQGGAILARTQRAITAQVDRRLASSSAGIAAALATGDMGGIADADAQAMRDSGLAHLLSVSGLHVSAMVGVTYMIALRLLALWPWLALRVRLPVVAAGFGALAAIAYTLLTGSQVPTVRSCVGALLVLAAVALGREALSLRMLAVAAFLVMLLWPEAVMGPSFQMSFAAVLAIVAMSNAGPVRRFMAPREESMAVRALRHLAMILLTGLVIELALMPIGLFHFHRAGLYGAFANVVAIPLTTFAIMPAVLAGLVLDVVGLGAPAWWVAARAIELLLALAHWIASRPGAVTVMPAMGGSAFALFVAGGLWLGLWSSKARWAGLVPIAIGTVLLALVRPPDLLISGDGRHVGIVGPDRATLTVLRESRSDFARGNLLEAAGMTGNPLPIEQWPGALCSEDACIIAVARGDRTWRALFTRSHDAPAERSLAAACERVDLVVSDRWLPRSCRPRWLKADRRLLEQTGGLAIDLASGKVQTVAQGEGRHGWWAVTRPAADPSGSGDQRQRKPPRSISRPSSAPPAPPSSVPSVRS